MAAAFWGWGWGLIPPSHPVSTHFLGTPDARGNPSHSWGVFSTLTCLPKASWPEEVPDWNPALLTTESLPCPSCVASSRVARGSACPPWASVLCLGSLCLEQSLPSGPAGSEGDPECAGWGGRGLLALAPVWYSSVPLSISVWGPAGQFSGGPNTNSTFRSLGPGEASWP